MEQETGTILRTCLLTLIVGYPSFNYPQSRSLVDREMEAQNYTEFTEVQLDGNLANQPHPLFPQHHSSSMAMVFQGSALFCAR